MSTLFPSYMSAPTRLRPFQIFKAMILHAQVNFEAYNFIWTAYNSGYFQKKIEKYSFCAKRLSER